MSPSIDDATLHAELERYFHYPAFRPGQLDALHDVLAGRDTLVVMPTGSGKSLIYQLAALSRPGTALVISPLVALMKDQADSLTRRGIAATYINSTLTVAEQDQRLRALASNQYKIVLVAPERLRSAPFRGALKNAALSLLAIDEAHCLSQWGHDFRPDYLYIAQARAEMNPPVTLALTATATLRVQDDIIKLLGVAHAQRIITGFNRPNLYLEVLNAPDVKTKLALTREYLQAREGAGLIYVGTRRDAEEVADFAQQVCKIRTAHYHAGLDNETRHNVQDAFLAGDLPLVVATNAFGMGIDRPDVRFVLHYTMPGTLEAYYQEAGRAGRDGLPARATLIYSPKDSALHESFIANDSPGERDLRDVHQYLRANPRTSFESLEQTLGMTHVMARVALEQLENARLIAREPYDEFGVMSVRASALNEAMLRQIAAQVRTRQEHKRKLLAKMVSFAETNACRRRIILDYFGDPGAADAPLCCDNDEAREQIKAEAQDLRPAKTDSEKIALLVLEAANAMQRKIGKGKLVDILKGSHAKDVEPFVKSPYYAKLAGMRKTELEALIAQFFQDGYLKQVGSEYPTLRLTPRGEAAINARAAIDVNLRAMQPGATERARTEKEAGGTILLTGQMLAQGRTPEQIAAERALTIGTIYSHLARLIADGHVNVNDVIPQPLQNQIRAVIDELGSAQTLSPIKARLPEEIDYNVIRCVANAWLREHGQLPPSLPAFSTTQAIEPLEPEDPALFQKLRAWRTEQARQDQVPPYVVFSDAVLHALAAQKPQSAYALLSIKGIGNTKAEKYGAQVIAIIIKYSAPSSSNAPVPPTPSVSQGSQSPSIPEPPQDIDEFLATPHVRTLNGPWRAGWALDFHSRFDGDTQNRSTVGDLVFRYKYRGEKDLARDLAARWVELLHEHSELPRADVVIPIPPSLSREFDPVSALARELASALNSSAAAGVLVKTRATKPQKEMNSLAQKQANVRGAFALKASVKGKNIILIDDLYDSGATLQEAARVLREGGAASILVLTLTKTIHAEH